MEVIALTLEELSQCFPLRERLWRDKEILTCMKAAASPSSPVIDGMPHMPGISDKTGSLAINITEMEQVIERLEAELAEKEKVVAALIDSVSDDEYLFLILRLRFYRCLSWCEVATIISAIEHAVKAFVYRFLRNQT